jgi:hypothetical protein
MFASSNAQQKMRKTIIFNICPRCLFVQKKKKKISKEKKIINNSNQKKKKKKHQT